MMIHMSYNRVNGGRRCHGSGSRGFRLNSRRFSVHGLRARFVYLFRLLSRWRFSLRKSLNRHSNSSMIKRNSSTTSRRGLVMEGGRTDARFRSFGRSNSFYSEAIADCLEFIKRSSISVDQNPVCQR